MRTASRLNSSVYLFAILYLIHTNIARKRPEQNRDKTKDQRVHHPDRGSQYLSIKYTERLAEAKIAPSVGSVGDSYDNALA